LFLSTCHAQELIIKFKSLNPQRLGKLSAADSTLLQSIQKRNSLVSVNTLVPISGSSHDPEKAAFNAFSTVRILRLAGERDLSRLIDSLNALPGVEYACLNKTLQIQQTPDDPDYTKQWAMSRIGIPAAFFEELETVTLLTADVCRQLMPAQPAENGHKGGRGHLLTIAGSRGRSGAALFTAWSALKTGCGLSTLATPSSLAAGLEGRLPELMMIPIADDGYGRVGEINTAEAEELCLGKNAVAVGPGLGTQTEAHELVATLLNTVSLPMVLDADALTVLASNPAVLAQKKAEAVLTPHPGEMSRLLGISTAEVQLNRLELARDFACRYQVFLVLKGAGTIIAAPDGRVAVNNSGNRYLATAGSGDVLTGIIGSFLAQDLPPWSACRLGVYLHGLTADLLVEAGTGRGITAGDLLNTIPRALGALEK